MNVQLTGCLRYIQTVLKELVDRDKGLIVKIIRGFVRKDLLDEHLAEWDRKLIDQAADSKLAVRNDVLLAKEDFSDIQGHTGLLVGVRDFPDLRYGVPVGNMHGIIIFRTLRERLDDGLGDRVKLLRPVLILKFLDDNNTVLIDRSNEIIL